MTELELEREEIRQLGQAMESLQSSVAWKFLRKWLAGESERKKGLAVVTEPGSTLDLIRDRFIGWQECEKVIIGLDYTIEKEVLTYKQMLEVEEDERNIRGDRSGW